VKSVRLFTNNPEKERGLREFGIEVTKCIPLEVRPGRINRAYLKTKKKKLGHLLNKV
jgi:3,4-dihydroxy 2-butanone 4-phosphate synthase/GTP cyclohydrolase II